MASNREERRQMRQRGAGIRKIKEFNFGFAFGLDPASSEQLTQPLLEPTAPADDATVSAPAPPTDTNSKGERRIQAALMNGKPLQTRNGSAQRTSPRNTRDGVAATGSTPMVLADDALEPGPQKKRRRLDSAGRISASPSAASGRQARNGLPTDEILSPIIATQRETMIPSRDAHSAVSEVPIATHREPAAEAAPDSMARNPTESVSHVQAKPHASDLVADEESTGQRRVRGQRNSDEAVRPANDNNEGAEGAPAKATTLPSSDGASRKNRNETNVPETSPSAQAKRRRGRPSAQSTAAVGASTASNSHADTRPVEVDLRRKRGMQASGKTIDDATDKSGPSRTNGNRQNGHGGTTGAESPIQTNDRATHSDRDRGQSPGQAINRQSQRRSTRSHEAATAPTPSAPASSREQVADTMQGNESSSTRQPAASQPPKRLRGRSSLSKRPTIEVADERYPQRDTGPSDSAPAPKRRRGRPSLANRLQDQRIRQEAPTAQQEPQEETAADERRRSKRTSKPRGDTVPVTVHRLANAAALGGNLSPDESTAENEDEDSSDELSSRHKTKLPSRGGVNPADVLSQICGETLEKALSMLRNGISTESNPGRRSEWTRKKKAVEAYASELEGRLFELSEILDSNFILGVQMKKAKREMIDLRGRLQQVRRGREEVALRTDTVRKKHADEEEAKMTRTTINNSLHSLELALDRSRARPGMDDNDDDHQRPVDEAISTDGLEFMLRTVAEEVSSSAPGAHGGILHQIKSFNAQLEAAARFLES